MMTFYYDMLVRMDNFYLHPSWSYTERAVDDALGRERNLEKTIMQMAAMFEAAGVVITIFLKNFAKRRPAFLKRLGDLSERFHSLGNAE